MATAKSQLENRNSTSTLIAIILLPLLVIGVQIGLGLAERWGQLGYSLYKVCFLVSPIVYCRLCGINIGRDIFGWQNWRRYLKLAVGLGLLSVAVFWGLYFSLRGVLNIDEKLIIQSTQEQFGVTRKNVLYIAPITIFLNSLLEEFFHRGFSFGLLVKKNRWLGYLLPATVFTIQHILFIYSWTTPAKLTIAIVALFVFALILQKVYEKSESLVTPWLIHIFADVAMMGVAIYLMFQGG